MTRVLTLELMARFRSRLEQGPTFGGWSMSCMPMPVEALAMAGFDWVAVDLQHAEIGSTGSGELLGLIRLLDSHGVPAVVRVPWARPEAVMQALDAGASSVIVPMVNSREEAAAAASWCRYAPSGVRSWGPVKPLRSDADYDPREANRRVSCFVMIETEAALRQAREILSAPGVDGVFIGPSDLTLSITHEPRGEATRDRMEEIFLRIRDIALECGVVPGISCPNGAEARLRAMQGFRFMPVGSDRGMMMVGARAEWAAAMAPAEKPETPISAASYP